MMTSKQRTKFCELILSFVATSTNGSARNAGRFFCSTHTLIAMSAMRNMQRQVQVQVLLTASQAKSQAPTIVLVLTHASCMWFLDSIRSHLQ